MSDLNERDSKLVRYLNDAYGREKALVAALEAHIATTTKAPYKKRLKQLFKETKSHAKALERRIKQLGGPKAVQDAKAKAPAVARGGEQEKMLTNAKAQYRNAHEGISAYLSLEAFAEKVSDKDTAKLVRGIRREEERMAKFLEGQIKSLSGAVATAVVPAAQRRPAKKAAPAKKAKAGKAGKAKAAPASKAKRAAPKKAKPAAKKAKASAARKTKAAAKKAAPRNAKAKAASRRKSA